MDKEKVFKEIISRVKKNHNEMVRLRRHLHQYPETANEEFKTTAYLTKEIAKLKLKKLPIKMKTGILAELTGNKKGKTVAVRTDIDALPIFEQSGVPYTSKIEGKMHACGHDMHMASIIGTAKVLSEMKEHLDGTVRFIFQPAEESPPGGATPMIENGALKNVSMIFGLHVDPQLPLGKVSVRDGVTMASVRDFDIIIKGTGGHAARPHFAVDAIVTAAEVIDSIQKIISRETDPISPTVITFGKISGGTARNVIADEVILTGTARTLSEKAHKEVPKLIKRTVDSICRARGAKAEIKMISNYPLLTNHPTTNRIFKKNYETLFGKGKVLKTPQTLGGEDFAQYLQKVPGAMFRLGVMNNKIGANKSWHSPKFKVDEESLIYGTSLLAASVIDYLGS